MKSLLVSLITMVAVSAFAESKFLDRADLTGCGGDVELRLAENGDVALKFGPSQTNRYGRDFRPASCPNLRFVDASSGKLIKEYPVKGTSYTLSKKMTESLETDCRLKVKFDNGAVTTQHILVYIPGCRPVQQAKVYPKNPYSYSISGNGNCKIYKNNVYTNQNTKPGDGSCTALSGQKNVFVRYEYSGAGHCKVMINNVFQQQMPFANKYYCDVVR